MATVINFWLMPNAGFESRHSIEQELAVFHELHPKIEVKCEIFSWSRAWFRLMQAIKEKSGPDVIQVGTTWIGTLSYLGAIQKLDHRKVNPAGFSPFSYNLCRSFDHLWAVPWFCEGRALFYRKDFLEKAACDVSCIENWEALRDACTRLNKLHTHSHQISPLGFSSHKEQAILQDIAGLMWSHGGNLLSGDGKHSGINQQPARHAIRYFLDLIAHNYISKPSLDRSPGEIVESFFLRDEFAFLFSSPWPLQVYLNPSFKGYIGKNKAKNIAVAPLPAGPSGRFNFAGGSALSMTSFTRYPEESWAFIDFMTGKESIARYCQKINMLPSRRDVPIILDHLPEAQDVFQQAINKFGRSFPEHPLWGSIEQVMVNGFAQSLKDYQQSGYDQDVFFRDLEEISQEIDIILSVFGE